MRQVVRNLLGIFLAPSCQLECLARSLYNCAMCLRNLFPRCILPGQDSTQERSLIHRSTSCLHTVTTLVLSFSGLTGICASTILAEHAGTELGVWRQAASAPTKRTEVTAAAVDGKIYVVGGFSEPALGNIAELTITDTVEEYDPSTDRWATKTPLPAKLHHAGAAGIGDRLYVAGGYTKSSLTGWAPVATLYIYDPASDRWAEGPPMPTARGALAVTGHAGKLFVVGGHDGSRNSSAVEVYDPVSHQWTSLSPLPTPRNHLATVSVSGRIYAIGGRLNGDGRNLSVVERYDPSSDRWSRVADLPTARSGIAAAVLGATVYVLGGEGPGGTFRTNEAYDAASNQWKTMAPMPTGRHGLGSAGVKGVLYVLAGGPTPGGSFSNITEVFHPPFTGQRSGKESPLSSRASPQQVGTVMALLATFDEAGVLPPEGTAEANQLIKALIQFQSMFMKSTHPEVRRYFSQALERKLGQRASEEARVFHANGWSSETLEAVVEFGTQRGNWDQQQFQIGLREFNLDLRDLDLLIRTFYDVQQGLISRGKDVHQVYAAKRREMPGSRSGSD